MRQSVHKHGKNYVVFLASILFMAAFVNGYFISSQVLESKQAKQSQRIKNLKILGETAPPANAPKNKLLVKFKKDPKIKYKDEISFKMPFLGNKVTLREEGFKSQTYGSKLNKTIKQQEVKKVKKIFAYENKESLQVFDYDQEINIVALKQELEQDPNIEIVAYDFPMKISTQPNDPGYKDNSHIFQWNLAQINMPEAWNIMQEKSVEQVVGVAVIDTGIAYENYDDVSGAYCDYEYCADPEECVIKPATPSIVPTTTPTISPIKYSKHDDFADNLFLPAYDSFESRNEDGSACFGEHANDDYGHGTHVAGTIAQTANNANKFAGIANWGNKQRVKLMPVKVIDYNNEGSLETVIAGLEHIKNYNNSNATPKIKVVNMSIGAEGPIDANSDALFYQAIIDVYNQGVAIIASAGNDGSTYNSMSYPARYPEVIGIGAVDYQKNKAPYSRNITAPDKMDLVAPGGNSVANNAIVDENNDGYPDGIWQTTLKNPDIYSKDFSQFTEKMTPESCNIGLAYVNSCGIYQGTSMAAPHVAAIAAVMFSLDSTLTNSDVRNILKNTTQTKSGYNENEYGQGLLDAQAAIEAVLLRSATSTPTPTNTPTGEPQRSSCGNGKCDEGEDKNSCYQDCCSYTIKKGDINKDCLINSADWGKMETNWTPAGDS